MQIEREDEWELRSKDEYYSAQLAWRLYLVQRQVASVIKDCGWDFHSLTDFLLEFGSHRRERKTQRFGSKSIEEMTPEEIEVARERAVMMSKAAWAMRLGLFERGVKPEDL